MNYIRNKKGFTLVEIIVVLVIIAILVATSLPALTGYIDDANSKTALSDGRTYLVAAQAIASEKSGTGTTEAAIEIYLKGVDGVAHVKRLTGADFKAPDSVSIASGGKVSAFKLEALNGKYDVAYGTSGMSATKK